MSDIVERLRAAKRIAAGWKTYEPNPLCQEAASEIEKLRADKLELANHIDGCVRVAADALKRAQAAEARCPQDTAHD